MNSDLKRLNVAASTDRGKRRSRNEDSIVVGQWYSSATDFIFQAPTIPLNKPIILAVADGIGGHKAGDIASQLVTQRLSRTTWTASYRQELNDALATLQQQLQQLGNDRPALKGMGTTIAGGIVHGSSLYHFNVGDSRVYLISGREVAQLSTDDCLPNSHVITQALGGSNPKQKDLNLHAGEVPCRWGDTMLICSDGLSNLVRDDELPDLCRKSVQEAGSSLMSLALERGGHDNISVVVARFG
ncbi:MAG: protein phosphatase 2C domain-containing protein [Xanthomonadales bacterium]|nr:protein phosphatase 2C domain-containing protein [Xanthomonadales bacterium]